MELPEVHPGLAAQGRQRVRRGALEGTVVQIDACGQSAVTSAGMFES